MTLAQWLERDGIHHTQLADKLGRHRISVSRWVRGQAMPRPAEIAAIHKMSGGAVTATDLQAEFLARRSSL